MASRRRVPPSIPGQPLDEPTPELRPAVMAAQAAEGRRIQDAWDDWHRAFGVLQRDPGRQLWAICARLTDDFVREALGPTPEAAVMEARRRSLNSWRLWASMYPRAMTSDCYEVTEAIILGFPWKPYLKETP